MTVAPLVLLDLDGTLTDSAPGIVASARAAYAALGLPAPADTTLRTFVGPPIVASFRDHGVPDGRIADAVAAYRAAFTAAGMWDNAVFDGIPEALAALRSAGATMLVTTSKPTIYARPITERFGLADLVDGVFGAPPDAIPSSKATVIGAALASLAGRGGHVPARTIMVGDREHDVLGAAAHGIATLGVAWGYAPAGELERAGALGVVGRPDDLAAAVLARVSRLPARPGAEPSTGR